MSNSTLSLVLLGVFLIVNVSITIARMFGIALGMTWRKILKVGIPENEKKGLERLYTAVWIVVGIWAALKLWDSSFTAALFGFLAFRSGANVTRTLIYGLHDQKILKEYTDDSRVLGIVGTATRFSLLLETLFIVAFALTYKALSVTLNSSETNASSFILLLWLSGLIFGILFGWIVARNNKGILLKNAIVTVGFFATRSGRRKTKGAIEKAKNKVKNR